MTGVGSAGAGSASRAVPGRERSSMSETIL